jgi:hypothetical protein
VGLLKSIIEGEVPFFRSQTNDMLEAAFEFVLDESEQFCDGALGIEGESEDLFLAVVDEEGDRDRLPSNRLF